MRVDVSWGMGWILERTAFLGQDAMSDAPMYLVRFPRWEELFREWIASALPKKTNQ